MKYIKRVILENFQSHKYSVIEFDNSLNVIVGPSDSGKSAIIRGLKWVLYNEPQGDYFIREGERECSVTVEFNDGTSLKRYRSPSKNSYILKKSNDEDIKYEGFGTNVPEEIVEAIGIKKIYLDGELSTSINFGEQLEGAFLLSEKNATKASAIGRLIGVNLIDDALREVLKDTRALNSKKKILEENVSKLTDEIRTFDYLEDLKITHSKINYIKSQLDQYNIKLKKLNHIKSRINEVYEDKHKTMGLIKSLSNVNEVSNKINMVENSVLKHKYLNNYKTSLDRIRKEVYENDIVLRKLSNIDEAKLIENKLLKEINRYNIVFTLISKYKQINIELKNIDIIINKLSTINKADTVLNEATAKIIKYNKLSHVNQGYINIKGSLNKGEAYLKKFSGIDALEVIRAKLENKCSVLSKYIKLNDEFLKNRSEINYQIDCIDKIKINLDKEIESYKSLLEKIEVCPLCLSEIDESKIEHILNHY